MVTKLEENNPDTEIIKNILNFKDLGIKKLIMLNAR
jgi:hypothetical protein